MAHLPFHTLNTGAPPPAAGDTGFTLAAGAPTDIWRKPGPPEISTFNAPIVYKQIALSSFARARVTVAAKWETLYDQGGLVFLLPSGTGEEGFKEGKWIKTGIEFYAGAPYVSTVTKDSWADWSLVAAGIVDSRQVTLEMARDAHEGTLWIYVVVAGQGEEQRIPVREVTWMLSEPEQEILVGVYVAKPTKGGEDELVVGFKGWELELL